MKNTWRFGNKELNYLREVIGSGELSGTTGNMNKRLEEAFAKKTGAKYAITFNSGTGTLHAALHAMDVNAGDEVIVPPLTVISNVLAILSQNAIPVFADIDPNTFNIDPEDIKTKITAKTKAIMPVSLYGLSCDLDPIIKIGEENGIGVINDAAQAHMSLYKGRPIGNIADITSYSLENTKHITTGDGGIVVTDNEEYAVAMRKFGCLGYASLNSSDGRIRLSNKEALQDPQHKRHDSFGFNYRMPEIAAALGLAQVEKIEYFIDLRLQIAELYKEAIAGCDFIVPQYIPENYKSTYWSLAVKYEREDVSWQEFRKKFVEYGGYRIYAAWALSYNEPIITSGIFKKRAPHYFNDIVYQRGICPIAENIQPKLMQFVTNFGNMDEAKQQTDALFKTIKYFE